MLKSERIHIQLYRNEKQLNVTVNVKCKKRYKTNVFHFLIFLSISKIFLLRNFQNYHKFTVS